MDSLTWQKENVNAIIKQNAQLDSSIEQSNTEQNNTRQSNSETPKIDAGSQCNVDTNTAVGLKRDSEPQKGSGVEIEIKAQSKIEQECSCNTMIVRLPMITHLQKYNMVYPFSSPIETDFQFHQWC